MFIGCTILRESEKDGYYVVQPSMAQGEAVEAIDIHRRGDLVPGNEAVLIQAGNQYGVAGLFHNLSSVIGVPDSARASIEAIAPANVACSYLAHLINRARVYYRRARVVEVISPWLNVRFFDGPFPNRTISVPIAPSQGLMASFFKPDDFVIVNTWQHREPSVTGWWEAFSTVDVWLVTVVSTGPDTGEFKLNRLGFLDAVADAQYQYDISVPTVHGLWFNYTRIGADGRAYVTFVQRRVSAPVAQRFDILTIEMNAANEVQTASPLVGADTALTAFEPVPQDKYTMVYDWDAGNFVTISNDGTVQSAAHPAGISRNGSMNTVYIDIIDGVSDVYPCVCYDDSIYVMIDGSLEQINLPYNARCSGALPLLTDAAWEYGSSVICDDNNLYTVKITATEGAFSVTTLLSESLTTPLTFERAPGDEEQISISFDRDGNIVTHRNFLTGGVEIGSSSYPPIALAEFPGERLFFGAPIWTPGTPVEAPEE